MALWQVKKKTGTKWKGKLNAKKPKKEKPVATKALVAEIKKVEKSMAETKLIMLANVPSTGYYGVTRFNSNINTTGDIIQLCPPLSQGVSDYMRIGDQITPTHCSIKGVISISGANESSNSVIARMFIVHDRLNPSAVNPDYSNVYDSLLNGANISSGNTAYLGQAPACYFPVNKNRFTVYHDKTYKLQVGTGTAQKPSGAGTMTFVPTTYDHHFELTIPTPASLKYNTQRDGFPTNWNPLLMIGYSQPDGNDNADVLFTAIVCSWVLKLHYKDS